MLVNMWVEAFKNLEEAMHVQVEHLSEDSTFGLFEFFLKFFSKI